METIEIGSTTVPALGFGTWQLRGKECVESVRAAPIPKSADPVRRRENLDVDSAPTDAEGDRIAGLSRRGD